MIFEWESPDRFLLNGMLGALPGLTPGAWQVVAPVAARAQTAGPVQIDLNPWRGGTGPASSRQLWGWTHVIGGTELNRETKAYSAKHVGVVFTREMIAAALNGQQIGAYGPGVIPVRWIDHGLNANYLLFLHVARQ